MKLTVVGILLLVLFALLVTISPISGQDQQSSFQYKYPGPEANYVSPFSSLIFREGSRFELEQISSKALSVIGSRSGNHTGTLALSNDKRTILFYPVQPFAYDERVTVEILPGIRTADGEAIKASRHQFQTLSRPVDPAEAAKALNLITGERHQYPPTPLKAGAYSAVALSKAPYITRPDLSNTMSVNVITSAHGTDKGLIFITHVGLLPNPDTGLLILDDQAEPIYLKVTTPNKLATDFKVQTVMGTRYLVYYAGIYMVMDDTYTVVDTWTMKNGHHADLHEIQLLDNGNAFMLSYTPVAMDLSPYGGPVNGIVIDIVIQELDPSKQVIFEWHSLDHIPLTDSYVSLADSPVDYLHTNAIEVDTDGNLLVSNRNSSDVIKINRSTGDVIWRLGGKQNDFAFTNDKGFSHQHDIRRLANGNISLFDNGNMKLPPYSRVVEYTINETLKTVTRVWQYPATQDRFAEFMGNGQRLGNGNTMISWGSITDIEEVKPDGSTALKMELEGHTYRAFRWEWEAKPSELPSAVLITTGENSATIYTSWNGATQITGYEVHSGKTAGSLTKSLTAPRTGFETTINLSDLDPETCVFKLRPVHAKGDSTPFSNIMYRLDRPRCIELLTDKTYLSSFIAN